jgi:hypothetical protein
MSSILRLRAWLAHQSGPQHPRTFYYHAIQAKKGWPACLPTPVYLLAMIGWSAWVVGCAVLAFFMVWCCWTFYHLFFT